MRARQGVITVGTDHEERFVAERTAQGGQHLQGRAVGPLALALDSQDAIYRGEIEAQLIPLLRRLHASDSHLLGVLEREQLCIALENGSTFQLFANSNRSSRCLRQLLSTYASARRA